MNHCTAGWQRATQLLQQFFSIVLCASLMACGGGSGGGTSTAVTPTPPPATTVPPGNPEIRVLMIGNSHTVGANLPARLAEMLRTGNPGRGVSVVAAPASLFLDEHLNHPPTLALLRSQPWNYVILQAQKYSSSGTVTFSIAEAITLVGLVRQVNAVPVMYPEWARRGIPETDRILAQHTSIAQQAPACVAPIGQAWDIALQRDPGLPLYANDGNHAIDAGAHLTALVLYATISGRAPASLPDLPLSGIGAAQQQQLRAAANDAVAAFPPRQLCPQDRLP